MNPLKAIKILGSGIINSSKRFPITLFYSTIVAILLIILTQWAVDMSPHTRDVLGRVTMVFALGIPLSLVARVSYERRKDPNLSKIILYYSIVLLIQILYYFLLLQDLNHIAVTRFIGINIVFYLLFLFIPYAINRKNFEMYVLHLFTSFLITTIYSMVLFIGLSAILFTTNHLLGVAFYHNIYYHTFLIVTLIFAPGYFLSFVPGKEDIILDSNYSKVLKILLLYIIMPLLTVYTFILYLYFGRIILSRTWPEGLVSHLVLWYSIILTVVLFFINPIKTQSMWPLTFSKWAPKVILPLLIMMFISMGIRINAYGVTENRYYVLALGCWALGSMLYLSFSKKRKFVFLPISLSIIVLLSVLGPISSYSISQYSQENQLESILIKNNMLDGKVINPAPTTISNEDKKSISSILNYFNSNHRLHTIAFLPEDFEINDMEKVFGFSYTSPYVYDNKYFYYSIERGSKVFDITQYDYLLEIRGLHEIPNTNNDRFNIEMSSDNNIMAITFDNRVIIQKDIREFAQYLNEHYSLEKSNSLPTEDMIIVVENEHYKFEFILQNIGGQQNSNDGDIRVDDLSFYLFVKVK